MPAGPAFRRWSAPENEAGCRGDHRGWAFVDSVDDLGVVDAAQVGRGNPEVGVAELTLDDHERDAFAGHLNGVCVSELVRGEPSAHPGPLGGGS